MMLGKDAGSAARFASVSVAWAISTLCYYWFSHYVHHHHFDFGHMQQQQQHQQHGHNEGPAGHGGGHGGEGRDLADDHQDKQEHHEDHRHGRRGDFDSFHLSHDKLFFWGLAVPLALLTLAGLVWTPKGGGRSGANACAPVKSRGDVNVKKWTLIWFLLPLVLIMLEGAYGKHVIHASPRQVASHEGFYIRMCMSLMSVSGYGATWALALFLIPVTKHSPILDWLRVTPVQALAFHRIAGWTSLWYSIAHGYLHLRHLCDVLNRSHERTLMEQLVYLLWPDAWSECLVTQNPFHVFWGYQDPYPGLVEEEWGRRSPADQCWLALTNLTGMVSCIAFAVLAVTSLESFRRKFYTAFYVVHIPMAWIMLVTAIWHYPTCVIIIVPNIVYYLSFNVPVWMSQAVERGIQRKRSAVAEAGSSALVEARLLEGGSVELTFAAAPHPNRHENRYVRVHCPSASAISHPFSIFARNDLAAGGGGGPPTMSVLLRSKGPFTEGIKEALFSADPPPSLSLHREVRFESYYAGSFDWVDRAAACHDEVLVVAGGVGVVPFLEFLPALQRRIVSDGGGSGPKSVRLHWYCREVGLASHVCDKYLRPHARGAWEDDDATRGRLKVHVHLTSVKDPVYRPVDEEGGVDVLASVHDSGTTERRAYCDDEGQQADTVCPVQDPKFMQSPSARLLLPGLLTTAGILLHWWWYEQFVVADQFRRNNLVIRTHGIVFSLVLAVLASVLAEIYYRRGRGGAAGYEALGREPTMATGVPLEQKILEFKTGSNYESTTSASSSRSSSSDDLAGADLAVADDFLEVTVGRPPIEDVVRDVLVAERPGVYFCGPRTLLEAVQGAIGDKRRDCAFYQEDPDM